MLTDLLEPAGTPLTWGPDGDRLLTLVRDQLRGDLLVRGPEVSGETYPGSARSYLGDGTGLAWLPEGEDAFAVDAELRSQRVPPQLLKTRGAHDLRGRPVEDFWQRWTRLEVIVKLLDVPMLTWIGRHGLGEPADPAGLDGRSMAITTVVAGPLVLSAGALG